LAISDNFAVSAKEQETGMVPISFKMCPALWRVQFEHFPAWCRFLLKSHALFQRWKVA
jgi:hypothetical protein